MADRLSDKQLECLKEAVASGVPVTPELISCFANSSEGMKKKGAIAGHDEKKTTQASKPDQGDLFSKSEKILIKPINGRLLI